MRPQRTLAAILLPVLAACGSAPPPPTVTTPSKRDAPGSIVGTLATPGPAAAACSDDSACGAHRCNVAAGKCAFPCVSDVDCAAGTCIHGAVAACSPAR